MKSQPLYFILDFASYYDPITIETNREYLSKPINEVFDYLIETLSEKFHAEKCEDPRVNSFDDLKEIYDNYKEGTLPDNYSFFLYALKKDDEFGDYIALFNYIPEKGIKIFDKNCLLDFPDIIKEKNICGHTSDVISLYFGYNVGCG